MKINFINRFMGLLVLLFYKIKNYLDCANFYTKKPAKHFCLQGWFIGFTLDFVKNFFYFFISQLSFNSYKKTSTTTFLALLFNPYKKVSTTFHVPAFWTYMCCLILIKRHLQHYYFRLQTHLTCCLILIKRYLQQCGSLRTMRGCLILTKRYLQQSV